MFRVLSLGGGVQSSALFVLGVLGKLPRWDWVGFSDTGMEPRSTLMQIDRLNQFAESRACSMRVEVVKRDLDMLESCRARSKQMVNSFCGVPLFVRRGNKWGMLPQSCTREFKVKPFRRGVRRAFGLPDKGRLPKSFVCVQSIGISSDESGRAVAIQKRSNHRWQVEFPLLELGWVRADCVDLLESVGLGGWSRSACVICPFSSPAQQAVIDADPVDSALAIEWLGHLEAVAEVHARFSPSDGVVLSTRRKGCSGGGVCFT